MKKNNIKINSFKNDVIKRVNNNKKNLKLVNSANSFVKHSVISKYTYNFSWLGRPIIQMPQDMIALQEIIWNTQPDLIIETGIAHGGSLSFFASMLHLTKSNNKPKKVIAIDIDIRPHNKKEILKHPLKNYIYMIEGSSIDSSVFQKVEKLSKNFKKIMVCLDSNHTEEHVLKELLLYSKLVSSGCYCVVFDTVINQLPKNYYPNRPWSKKDNPRTAITKFLKNNKNFSIDKGINNKLLISMAMDGYLKKK